MSLSDDPRWLRFNNRDFQCPCCGLSFTGVFDIAFDHPDPWPHMSFRESKGEGIRVGNDVLDSDFCKFGDHVFVRGLIQIPILESETPFSFGVWPSLHKENFRSYLQAYNTEEELKIGPCFGWLSNDIPIYGIGSFLQTTVIFQGSGKRPLFEVHDARSPLFDDQQHGISFDRLLDIYAACGTDIRPHLLHG
jgi:hypothetical protein